ncbi:MAG: ribose 5-phosphate isomerase B [Clostridia bacterium]|nr:ribose 5-phosphate isomerase B [Clostridia bacterium]
MKIAIACDPAGEVLKGPIEELLTEKGIEYVDFGIREGDPRDYPIFGVRAANAVAKGECDRGIILCGTGVGISMAANKVKGIRCCCCSDYYSATLSRAHNDSNMLALGGRVIAPENARLIVEGWLTTEFEGGRHQRRIDMFKLIEEGKPVE